MGVEPTTSAWEANVLPINYIRIDILYHIIFLLSRGKLKILRMTYKQLSVQLIVYSV